MAKHRTKQNEQKHYSNSTLPAVGSAVWITQPGTKTPYVANILQHFQESNRNGMTEIQWSICGRKEVVDLKECQIEFITSCRRGRQRLKLSPKQRQRQRQRQKRSQPPLANNSVENSNLDIYLEKESEKIDRDVQSNTNGEKKDHQKSFKAVNSQDMTRTITDFKEEGKYDTSCSNNTSNQQQTQLFINEIEDDDILSYKNDEVASPGKQSNAAIDNFWSQSKKIKVDKTPTIIETPRNLYQQEAESSTNLTDPTSEFDFYINSAYLQHLAEMCHMVLHDMRWKTGHTQLFEWQNGDDLGAIIALENLYQGKTDCKIESMKDVFQKYEENFANVRQLYLYARLFHRKGPWYNLDDLFFRYYFGNKWKRTMSSYENKDIKEFNDNRPKHLKPQTKESNFEPIDETNSIHNSTQLIHNSNKNDNHNYITLESSEKDLSRFFSDIQELCSRGLFRTFSSERECGIIAGNIDASSRNGTLLTSTERESVLQKLGGTSPKKRKKGEIVLENSIWKQMRTQRSIFSSIHSSEMELQLPVRHHVNSLFLRKFSGRLLSLLIKKSSHTVNTVSIFMAKIWKKSFENAIPRRPKSFPDLFMCIRLREQPLLTLRRAIRLILCASSGPGIMRNDPYSGWGLTVIEPPSEANEENSHHSNNHFFTKNRIGGKITLPKSPDTSCWGKISYRSLHKRLGLIHCEYEKHFEPLPYFPLMKPFRSKPMFQTFLVKEDFLKWETSLEIRTVVDYLIEWNDSVLYINRKKSKIQKENRDDEKDETINESKSEAQYSSDKSFNPKLPHVDDTLHLLCAHGRKMLIDRISALTPSSYSQRNDSHQYVSIYEQVKKNVEIEIESLKILHKCCGCSSRKPKMYIKENPRNLDSILDVKLNTDAEKIIYIIAIICNQVLLSEYQMINSSLPSLVHRPWLRHMYWPSVLAHIVWDCVKIVEKTGHHELAIFLLQSILIGSTQHSTYTHFYNNIFDKSCEMKERKKTGYTQAILSRKDVEYDTKKYVQLLLSRRTRGKAFDRLFIDLNHVLRKQKKYIITNDTEESYVKEQMLPHSEMCMRNTLFELFSLVVSKSSIPFSSIRSLARRLKKPFKWDLICAQNNEISELSLRISNESNDHDDIVDNDDQSRKMNYWTPIFDSSVANAIVNDASSKTGKRCSFMGNEGSEDAYDIGRIRSLTVEELAIEEYYSGRLPVENAETLNSLKGGWVGWHDEGGHVRTLFRIFLSSILGSHHSQQYIDEPDLWYEKYTIFLTPYQSSPHDLHVGHFGKIRSFYERRRHRLQLELRIIEKMSDQEVSDFFHDSITKRKKLADMSNQASKDQWLLRDMNELRTLSMVAAGLGGKMLSRIFQALCYDYRYYSGGLPDLLLVRAISQKQDRRDNLNLVNLGSWIGECFDQGCSQNLKAHEMARMYINREDEFLGYTQERDNGMGMKRTKRKINHSFGEEETKISCSTLPPKLSFLHENRRVLVQCMFIEVKSANDRLDGRQEDWLNILDASGHARVCKFHASAKNKKKR